jgi:hypothetical protein
VRGRESSDPLAGERPGIPGSKSAHPVLPVSATPTTGAVGSRTGRRLGAGDGSPFIGDLRRCPRRFRIVPSSFSDLRRCEWDLLVSPGERRPGLHIGHQPLHGIAQQPLSGTDGAAGCPYIGARTDSGGHYTATPTSSHAT